MIRACVRNAIAGAIYAVGHSVILIQACARIATKYGFQLPGDCPILIQACARIAIFLVGAVYHEDVIYFNSCMREDCNSIINIIACLRDILIHACVRIATCGAARLGGFCLFQFMHVRGLQRWFCIPCPTHFNSCMCEDCNNQENELQRGNIMDFNSCMRKDCNVRLYQIVR